MNWVSSDARRAFAAVCAALLALSLVILPARAGAPAIWRVDGGPEPVWLFGTMHLLPPETEWQTKLIAAALANADVLVLETVPGAGTPASVRQVIREKAFLGKGRELRDHLSPEGQVTYEMIGNRLGMFPAVLDGYRPWYAGVLLSMALHREQGFEPGAGVERVLKRQARAAGKTVAVLEAPHEHMNLLAGMPEDVQLQFLEATLQHAQSLPRNIGDILDAWKEGDTAALDALTNGSLRRFPDLHDRLLVRRNRRWASRIEGMVRDKRGYFIAVGVAHLVGEESVIAVLRERGYRVIGP